MYSETFFKIGGVLQFLTGVMVIYQGYGISEMWKGAANKDILTVQVLIITLFLFSMSAVNLLISRSGMPLGLYKSFTLINILTWALVCLISVFYLSLFYILLHGLILLAFVFSFFLQPKFQ